MKISQQNGSTREIKPGEQNELKFNGRSEDIFTGTNHFLSDTSKRIEEPSNWNETAGANTTHSFVLVPFEIR